MIKLTTEAAQQIEEAKVIEKMQQDEIIRMAEEAGFDIEEGLFPFEAAEDKYIGTERTLERFAALVAAHEREACAVLCLQTGIKHPQQTGQEACAAAIRARGEK